MQEESTHVEDPPVAVRVTRRVKPERVEEFEEWASGIIAATSRFPGHLGAEVLKPGDPSDTEYHIIFKFDRMSNLERWEDSDERRDWCSRVESLQEGPGERHVVTGLERWFVLLVGPRTGGFPDFPNSFSTHSGEYPMARLHLVAGTSQGQQVSTTPAALSPPPAGLSAE